MKIGDKEFSEYWKIIKIPTLVMIGWSILSLVAGIISPNMYFAVFSSIGSWILIIAAFGFIGWISIKDFKERIGVAGRAGAISGIISGFIGGIIGILMFYFAPQVIQASLQQAVQAGANLEQVQSLLGIWVYTGLISGPLINALIGGIISLVAAFIASKV